MDLIMENVKMPLDSLTKGQSYAWCFSMYLSREWEGFPLLYVVMILIIHRNAVISIAEL
jgi:hypothetical protein